MASLIAATPASGQWYVSGGWGSSEDLDTSTSGSVQSFQLGVQGFTDAGRLLLTGGVPVRTGEDLTWGLVEAATSPFIGTRGSPRFGVQPDFLGRGFVYHDPVTDLDGAGGLLKAEPYAAYASRGFRARAGGGIRVVGTSAGGMTDSRSAGVVAADLLLLPAPGLTVSLRGEALYFEERSLPHGEVLVHYDRGLVGVWGGLDRWDAEDRDETGWFIGGSVDLTHGLSARATVGRSTGDPLFDSPPRDSWSVGLRYRIADRPGRQDAGLPEYDSAGGVHLRVPVDLATDGLSVAGSFNDWQPIPMSRSGDDWTVQLELDPGYHELAFVDVDGRWFVPESLPGRRADGMGGWVLVLIVR